MSLRGVAKGTAFETAVARFLGVERRAKCGNLDRGDLVHPWTLEIKAPGRGQPLDLSRAMREAKVEAVNAGTERWACIVRRTGYPVGEAYFVMPLGMAREVLDL